MFIVGSLGPFGWDWPVIGEIPGEDFALPPESGTHQAWVGMNPALRQKTTLCSILSITQ